LAALWLKILLQSDIPEDGNLTISATEELSSHLPFVFFARFVVKYSSNDDSHMKATVSIMSPVE